MRDVVGRALLLSLALLKFLGDFVTILCLAVLWWKITKFARELATSEADRPPMSVRRVSLSGDG